MKYVLIPVRFNTPEFLSSGRVIYAKGFNSQGVVTQFTKIDEATIYTEKEVSHIRGLRRKWHGGSEVHRRRDLKAIPYETALQNEMIGMIRS